MQLFWIRKKLSNDVLVIFSLFVFGVISYTTLNAANTSKQKKMQKKIKQQQDTIDLLKLQLERKSGGYSSNSYSYPKPHNSGKTTIPANTITYP